MYPSEIKCDILIHVYMISLQELAPLSINFYEFSSYMFFLELNVYSFCILYLTYFTWCDILCVRQNLMLLMTEQCLVLCLCCIYLFMAIQVDSIPWFLLELSL